MQSHLGSELISQSIFQWSGARFGKLEKELVADTRALTRIVNRDVGQRFDLK